MMVDRDDRPALTKPRGTASGGRAEGGPGTARGRADQTPAETVELSRKLPPAIVLNCHYNGLSLIRALGRHGVPVLAWDNARTLGRFSRYARFSRCPDPLVSEDFFIRHLLDMGPRFEQKPILFPTNDHWVSAIARHKDLLSAWYVPNVPDWPLVSLILQKQQFYEWGFARGYPVPRSWRADRAGEIPDSAFPLAAKPEYRRMSGNEPALEDTLSRLDLMRLVVLKNRHDAERFLASNPDLVPYYLFQEYVEGLSDSVYCIRIYADQESRVRALFSGKKVRGFPPDIGECVVGQMEPVSDELKLMVKRMCRELNYQGIAEFEFKRDAVTGVFKLLEINPRSWGWIGITPATGVSLPWIAYSDLAGIGRSPYVESAGASGSIKYAKICEDFVNCMYANRRAGYPGWHLSPLAWWRSLRADRLVSAEFAWDDPVPGFYVLASTFLYLFLAPLKKAFQISLRKRGRRSKLG